MTAFSDGVYKPPKAILNWVSNAEAPYTYFPAVVAIEQLHARAGATPATCVVSFPSEYAKDATITAGAKCFIQLETGAVLFRGAISEAPFEIDVSKDTLRLTLLCDKWGMAAKVLGQGGVGTQPPTPPESVGGDGFQHVGFDIIFNKDGIPNKDASNLDFSLFNTAVYWTLKDILSFIFQYYISSELCVFNSALITGAWWTATPQHLSLIGQSATQAIDTICQLAGESWTIIHNSTTSAFRCVKPSGDGTTRIFALFKPLGGSSVTGADAYCPDRVSVGRSTAHLRDTFQAMGGPIVKEITHSNKGDNPLLVLMSAFKDKKFKTRFSVNPQMYSIHGLGADRAIGSKLKPWKAQLVSRKTTDGSDYLTAAQISADPNLLKAETGMDPLLWFSATGDAADAKLVTGGYRIDTRNCFLDFEKEIMVRGSTADGKDRSVRPTDWATHGIWLTIATEVETRSYAETAEPFLSSPRWAVVHKPELVQQTRWAVWVPDLSATNPNAVSILAPDAQETYVDIEDEILSAAAQGVLSNPELERRIEMDLPFLADVSIGDGISVVGRETGLTGREVVVALSYKIFEAFCMTVSGTNCPAARGGE
jgi:hypothetical protein